MVRGMRSRRGCDDDALFVMSRLPGPLRSDADADSEDD
jgi:hypothetical protein